MTAELIDGKAFAAGLVARIAAEVAAVKAAHGITPGLAVVLVGDDPASGVSADRRWAKPSIPTSAVALPLARTYPWLAGSSPTSPTARPALRPHAASNRRAASPTRARSEAAKVFPSITSAVTRP